MKLLMVCCLGVGLALTIMASAAATPTPSGNDINGSTGVGNRGGRDGGTGGGPFSGRPSPIR